MDNKYVLNECCISTHFGNIFFFIIQEKSFFPWSVTPISSVAQPIPMALQESKLTNHLISWSYNPCPTAYPCCSVAHTKGDILHPSSSSWSTDKLLERRALICVQPFSSSSFLGQFQCYFTICLSEEIASIKVINSFSEIYSSFHHAFYCNQRAYCLIHWNV